MKRKITILSSLIMFTTSMSNIIIYKNSNSEQINQNISFKSENYLELGVRDVISPRNVNFSDCSLELWFVPVYTKKKLKLTYQVWMNYFGPMINKIKGYFAENTVSNKVAGKIKVALINIFGDVIKNNFSTNGNTEAKNPYWDGYKQAASLLIKNEEYLDNFFRYNGPGTAKTIEYGDSEYFLDNEQLEALGSDSSEKVNLSDIEAFHMPSLFPVLKYEIWDIKQDLFNDEKTSISVSEIDDKKLLEFKFGETTMENLEKSLDKYSSINKIFDYFGNRGWVAISFCTILKNKILEYFKIDETIAMQFATYIYKYRDNCKTWGSTKGAYIEENFYWFEDDMNNVYVNNGSSFHPFEVLSEWPI